MLRERFSNEGGLNRQQIVGRLIMFFESMNFNKSLLKKDWDEILSIANPGEREKAKELRKKVLSPWLEME